MVQANQRLPLHITIRNPIASRAEGEAVEFRQRLAEAQYRGETLMREYLSLLIDSENFEDNAAPGFLVNPTTDERMELDRFYPPGTAFEFNGPQHYAPTERFTAMDVKRQRSRDLMKRGICGEQSITLIVIHPQDLLLNTLREKVGGILPLRDLTGHEPLLLALEEESRRYRRWARRKRFTLPTPSTPETPGA